MNKEYVVGLSEKLRHSADIARRQSSVGLTETVEWQAAEALEKLVNQFYSMRAAILPFDEYGAILTRQRVSDDGVVIELFDTKLTVSDFRNLARVSKENNNG